VRKYGNIRLRKTPIITERVLLINKIISEYLNEVFDSPINTDYTIEYDDNVEIYRFTTNSGNSYDLEFIRHIENCNNKLVGGGTLNDYIRGEFRVRGGNYCLVVDLAFVPSEINMSDRDNHELYTKETNRSEQYELMGRISFLVKEYIKNNPEINVFIIGKNTKETKLKIYNKIFDNIFSTKFNKFEGENSGYKEGSFYFIKK
jgi:hypothetical protein